MDPITHINLDALSAAEQQKAANEAVQVLLRGGFSYTNMGWSWHDSNSRVTLREATVRELVDALEQHGGTWTEVAKACQLVLRKSEDYNKDALDRDGTDSAKRDVYFPLGTVSYAQMIHVKSQRVLALVDAEMNGRPVNFEGLRDTALDLINYASFFAERLTRDEQKAKGGSNA